MDAVQVDLRDPGIVDTALHVAAAGTCAAIFSAIWDAVTSTEAHRQLLAQANEHGCMPLHCLFDSFFVVRRSPQPSNAAVAKLLLAHHRQLGVPVDQASPRDGAMPLLIACRADAVEVADELLLAGAEVNAGTMRNETPLMAAVTAGDPMLVDRLIVAGADVRATTAWARETALHMAVNEQLSSNKAKAIVRSLLEAGADVNALDEEEKSAVIWAAELSKEHLVRH
jgi:ankyrin repeat protein